MVSIKKIKPFWSLLSFLAPLTPPSFKARPLIASLFGIPTASPEAALAKTLQGLPTVRSLCLTSLITAPDWPPFGGPVLPASALWSLRFNLPGGPL